MLFLLLHKTKHKNPISQRATCHFGSTCMRAVSCGFVYVESFGCRRVVDLPSRETIVIIKEDSVLVKCLPHVGYGFSRFLSI